MKSTLKIVLAGNPNAGKTTIYNNLTGSRQHVGNYPGVTVEKREGHLSHRGYEITVIDLPGTYSLSAFSPDEIVARNVLLEQTADVVINVVDALNLERNLYLTSQLKEMGAPLLIALNMADMADKSGMQIDLSLLETLLGAPVAKTVGHRNEGIRELIDKAIDIAEKKIVLAERPLTYRRELEKEIQSLQASIELGGTDSPNSSGVNADYNRTRWQAIKLLENDADVINRLKKNANWEKIDKQLGNSVRQLQSVLGDEPELLIVDGRYAFVRGVCREVIKYPAADRATVTEAIDKVLLNRIWGIPIFLGMMWILFQLTFTLGAPLMDWMDAGFSWLGDVVTANTQPGLLQSLLVDGIIGGVGGVLVFLPNIILLFLGIALLEDSGYMSRAAFIMDRIMHRIGLHGKSFVPLLIGFGCNIPAIMATRTLENEKDRLVTMLVAPLISCGARLPVYTLLIAAFFHQKVAGTVLFSIYLIGIIMAILMAKLFRSRLLPGESEPFVMELPAYRWPTAKGLAIHMWERAWLYMKKAGTIILAASIIVWFLFTFPMTDANGNEFSSASEQMAQSYAGRIGHAIEPVFSPLGFDWRTDVALIAGAAAKEVVVSTMGTLYSIDDSALSDGDNDEARTFSEQARENSGMTPLKAYALMIFVLLYVPCFAAIAVIKRETNGWKWPAFTVAYTLCLAWIMSFIVYRGGLLLGLG
ncbi:MAG TPA: ferrous iron transport protein B [Syntrophomonas sp.]|nr:ferrous iron transport protein B [Syntrophomonas sp.]